MNLDQVMISVNAAIGKPGSPIIAKGKCPCRGACGGHTGPCMANLKGKAKLCKACSSLAEPADEVQSAADIVAALNSMTAGGPGSGRHKTGISDLEKQSVMSLRRSGFKRSRGHDVGKTNGFVKTSAKGHTHVMNVDSKGGFAHSVSKGARPNFKSQGIGSRKQLGSYISEKGLDQI